MGNTLTGIGKGESFQQGETKDGYRFEVFPLSFYTPEGGARCRWGWVVVDKIDGLPIAAGVRRLYVEACRGVNAAIKMDRLECLPV